MVRTMAGILSAFAGRCLSKLLELVEGEASKVLGVKNELRKLQRRLLRIRGVLEDAERRRHTSPDIATWVMEMKDIMYDVDDLIDLCKTKGEGLWVSHSLLPATSDLHSIPFCYEIANRVKEINERLDEIGEDRTVMSRLQVIEPSVVHVDGVNPRDTSPLVVESDIVGTDIEDASERLVSSLLAEDKQKWRIFGIVGMGGIGKTTLARKVYNDRRIRDYFPKQSWLCVSKNFSETELLKELIRSIGADYGEARSKAELELVLAHVLPTQLFIVLDDVWNANVWEDLLRTPLESGLPSGRILITTRDDSVARSMRASIHYAEKMDEFTSWMLLCRMVFENREDEEIQNLEEIGREIVKKCDGLPLAIKTTAGVLRSKERSRKEWNRVLESGIWSMSQLQEELPRALYLSYEDLPSNLKQCFLFCSLYPENRMMHYKDLASVWVAEGFVRPQGDRLLEDLAEGYYKELLGRNLLQLDPFHLDQSRCRMHGLLRSLARFLVEEESAFISHGQTLRANPLSKIRRLSISKMGDTVVVPDVIVEQNCLRTLLLSNSFQTKRIEDGLLEKLRHLRVLDLEDTEIDSIPDALGNLIHLRYLDLDRTRVGTLPESIGCLINLETLNLQSCIYLHSLPRAITRLQNLRCLRVEGTPLSHLPKGIGNLRNINHLEAFVVGHGGGGRDEGCDLDELQPLANLRFLCLVALGRASRGASALANKPFLKHLYLSWLPPCVEADVTRCTDEAIEAFARSFSELSPPSSLEYLSEEENQRNVKIYNELSPPPSLEYLSIYHFLGREFPKWMDLSMAASFPNLSTLYLHCFISCTQLPPLGQLPQLKLLSIARADAIVAIGPELLHGRSPTATSFPKLELLELLMMPKWEEWSLGETDPEEVGHGRPRVVAQRKLLLPRLKRLYLLDCPKLKALPQGLQHATNLEELSIYGAHELGGVDNLPSLTVELFLRDNQRLEKVSDLPMLRSLVIQDCPTLRQVGNLNALQVLVLQYNSLMKQSGRSSDPLSQSLVNLDEQAGLLPLWLPELLEQHKHASAGLRILVVKCSLPLLQRFCHGGPYWHIIHQIPAVIVSTEEGSAYMTYTKNPYTYETSV